MSAPAPTPTRGPSTDPPLVPKEADRDSDGDSDSSSVGPNLRHKYEILLEKLEQQQGRGTGAVPSQAARQGKKGDPGHQGDQQERGANPDELLEAMKLADRYFSEVENPHDFLLDGRVVKTLSRFCRQEAEALSANMVDFTPEQFAARLGAEKQGQQGQQGLAIKQWGALGVSVRRLFHQPPRLTFLRGALATEEEEQVTKPVREKKARVEKNSTHLGSTQMIQQTTESDGAEGKTELLVRSTLKHLVRLFRDNGGKPIQYFRFIIDPTSFGATVENIFHVSFLVKENRAKIFIDGFDGLPYIQPLKNAANKDASDSEDDENEVKQKKQVVIGMDIKSWKSLVKHLKITTAAIKHK